ncbi:MAG TPA: DUF4279 domain-containing protein [Aggregatilineaceae bacterium]|nr:DUF4279 domain-containing protein [Aggregatilineaceae bacterium]
MFRTLRGFLTGQEDDGDVYFAYSATLRISGEHLDFDNIRQTLRVSPTHCHRKGERKGQLAPPYAQDMWSYKPPVPGEHPLEEHINALWADIQPAKAYLLTLKETSTVDVFLGYRSNSDTAGLEIPHTCLAMFVELEIPFGLSIIIA